MYLPNTRVQEINDHIYDASVVIGSGSKLVLPVSKSRSFLLLQNLYSTSMWVEFGSARATCTIQSGAVSTLTITNAGFNFTIAPDVRFYGGSNAGISGVPNGTFLGLGQPQYPSPSNIAVAHAVLSGNTVGSITLDNPGSGYTVAPMVFISNRHVDPSGVADPNYGSVNSGILLPANSAPMIWNGTACPTDAISVAGTSGATLTCKWMA